MSDVMRGDGPGAEILDLLASGQPAAFASDSRDRIVSWNVGAAELFGRRADEVLGRRCYDVVGGCDVFGNSFCYANCPVNASLRAGRPIAGFEMDILAKDGRKRVEVTVLRIPSIRPDLFTAVHILRAVEGSTRRSLAVESLDPLPSTAPVSEREQEILGLVATGLQNKEIAQRLGLSVATVRNHVHNILEKLHVHSKLEAVSLAFRSGWVRSRAF